MEPLKSVEEAAETLALSPWTIRLYVRQGKIRPVRIGRRVLIEPREIERIIEAVGQGYALGHSLDQILAVLRLANLCQKLCGRVQGAHLLVTGTCFGLLASLRRMARWDSGSIDPRIRIRERTPSSL